MALLKVSNVPRYMLTASLRWIVRYLPVERRWTHPWGRTRLRSANERPQEVVGVRRRGWGGKARGGWGLGPAVAVEEVVWSFMDSSGVDNQCEIQKFHRLFDLTRLFFNPLGLIEYFVLPLHPCFFLPHVILLL